MKNRKRKLKLLFDGAKAPETDLEKTRHLAPMITGSNELSCGSASPIDFRDERFRALLPEPGFFLFDFQKVCFG